MEVGFRMTKLRLCTVHYSKFEMDPSRRLSKENYGVECGREGVGAWFGRFILLLPTMEFVGRSSGVMSQNLFFLGGGGHTQNPQHHQVA